MPCALQLLAQILWAMASTGWQAKTSRLDTLARRIVSAGGAGPSRAQALSLTLHALARMTYLPVGDLWDDLENAIGDVLEDMSVRDLKSTIWASAFLDLKLRPDILYRLVEVLP